MNRFDITNAMLYRAYVLILGSHDGREFQQNCLVTSVALEDGSGYNLLLDVVTDSGKVYKQVFVRCKR